jgi:hypothetical protein
MNIGDRYVNALTKKYEAQIAEAEANLALYFSSGNLAAIGEHSDLMEEQDKWISNLAEAKDKLETLKSLNLRDSSIERINS